MPKYNHYISIINNPVRVAYRSLRAIWRTRQHQRRHNSENWIAPAYRGSLKEIRERNDSVVVYPEVVFGNPYQAKNIARWLLHEPGFHTKDCYFVAGEVHFRYQKVFNPVPMPWIEISDQLLTVLHVPWEHYEPPPEGAVRRGTAYLIRKGKGKPLVHDANDSIQIDGMSHAEVGRIFRQVETFISYDTRTLYSSLAALAGADSVVVPDAGVSKAEWQPDPTLCAGLAYGFDDLEAARASRPKVREYLLSLERDTDSSVSAFAQFWVNRLKGEG